MQKQPIVNAIKQYATDNKLEISLADNGDITLMPGDILLQISDNGLICNNPEVRAAIVAILPPEYKGSRSSIVSVDGRKSCPGQIRPLTQAVRDIQVAELTFEDIKTYICPDANDQEAFMFLKLCQARNLNPFTKEAYLVKYGGKANMIVGKEAFTRKAELNPQFDGFSAGIIIKQKDGAFLDLPGTFYDDSEDKLVGGWAEVHRKDRAESFIARVSLKEYSKGQATWKDMPATMIRKVALVSALREAFPSDLSGMYEKDELGIDPDMEVKA